MKQSLGQKIKDLRVRKGLTQSELSEGLVTPSMISQIESDKANPSHQLLSQIAEKLETPIEFFLTDIESQQEKLSAYKVARAIMDKGEYKQAIKLLSSMKDEPSTQHSLSDVNFDLATCYLHTGKYDKANSLFEDCLETAITDKDTQRMMKIQHQLGIVAYEQYNYPIAMHYWKKAYDAAHKETAVDPVLLGEITYRLGMIQSQMGEWDTAKELLTEAASSFKQGHSIRNIADVYAELAKSHRDNGDYERASQYAESASALYQGINSLRTAIDVESMLGVVLGETGSTEQGIYQLEKCKQEYENYDLHERTGFIHSSLARVYVQAREFEKAVYHCEKALELIGRHEVEKAAVYRMLATIHLEKNDYQEAFDWIDKAAEIVDKAGIAADRVKVYAVYGELYKKQGKYREAMESLEKMNVAMVENLRDRKVIV